MGAVLSKHLENRDDSKLGARGSKQYHLPALLNESVDALVIRPEGIYVDATFGGGGHSREILRRLNGGRLIAFDQDDEAKEQAQKIDDRSFTFCHANFMYLKEYLKLSGVDTADGILADLGISSHQIDSAQRGFSTRLDGPLDMRMDRSAALTAETIVNEYTEAQLHRILGIYGEVRNAKTVAHALIRSRTNKRIRTTGELIRVLESLAPKGKENKYFAQVFQALRIEVNEEMKALELLLRESVSVLKPGGRLVVITYHSLEDRMVKSFMNSGKPHGEPEKDMYGNVIRPFESVTRKPVTPSEEEIKNNPRARSAKLRIGVRTDK